MKNGNGIMVAILTFCIIATGVGVVKLFISDGQSAIVSRGTDSLFKQFTDSRPGIGVVKVYGPIYNESEGAFMGLAERGSDAIVKKLDSFRRNNLVKAVVLRINSPGGTIGASQEIYDAVVRLTEANKKVIVSMGDVAASGGYYIAAPADKIVANRGTITGSIGVIMAGYNFSDLMKNYGVKMNVIKQGKNKDILAFWRDMKSEERELLEKMSKNAYDQFLEAVSKGRNIPKNELMEFADGRIMTGEQAKELKLVDTLGGFKDAVRLAAKDVGLDPDNPHLIERDDYSIQRLLDIFSQTASGPRSVDFMRLILNNQVPLLYYSSLPVPIADIKLS